MANANKGSELFAHAIKAMLDKRAADDELFAKSYAKESKSIDECCHYIINTVEQMGVNALSAEEVEGLAVHYYDENDIKPDRHTPCRIVVPTTPEIEELRKEELRKNAERDYYDKCLAEMRNKQQSKAAKREQPQEMSQSLF